MGHTFRAPSTTIRFAIDARTVRLRARVDAMARVSHARWGSGSAGTRWANSITAGTFETRFESTATAAVREATPWASRAWSRSNSAPVTPAARAAPTTTNRPAKR